MRVADAAHMFFSPPYLGTWAAPQKSKSFCSVRLSCTSDLMHGENGEWTVLHKKRIFSKKNTIQIRWGKSDWGKQKTIFPTIHQMKSFWAWHKQKFFCNCCCFFWQCKMPFTGMTGKVAQRKIIADHFKIFDKQRRDFPSKSLDPIFLSDTISDFRTWQLSLSFFALYR